MQQIGTLTETNGRFEFRLEKMDLVVRGSFAEWVLEAAAEIVAQNARMECESKLDEVTAMHEFGEASEIEVDAATYDARARLETIPQCSVSWGQNEYRWAAADGRQKLAAEFDGHPMRRVHDMSLTRHDSFLVNVDGVDTAEK